jgi:chromosome segregation ATPase
VDAPDYDALVELLADEAKALANCSTLLRLARHRIRELEVLAVSLCETIQERDATIAAQTERIAELDTRLSAALVENVRLTDGLAALQADLDRLLHPEPPGTPTAMSVAFDQPTKRST